MSTVLRIAGQSLDIDAFLANSPWVADSVTRAGETSIGGKVSDRNSFTVLISEAGFDDLPSQISDAISFLTRFIDEFRRLHNDYHVEDVGLDCGTRNRDVPGQTDVLPLSLIQICAQCGCKIALSKYMISD